MAKGERVCVVCGKKYVYCPNCKQGNPKETWRFMYDSEQCRDIFKACSDFAFGHINAEAAKKRLAKYDLSDVSAYSEDMRRNLSAINANTAKSDDAPKAEETSVKEPKAKRNNRKFVNDNNG